MTYSGLLSSPAWPRLMWKSPHSNKSPCCHTLVLSLWDLGCHDLKIPDLGSRSENKEIGVGQQYMAAPHTPDTGHSKLLVTPESHVTFRIWE